jgi:glucose 1-dehydrogenase
MKTAIVTGGARGIGGATTARLRRDGYEVAVFDRLHESDAAERGSLYHQCDIGRREEVERGFSAVAAAWGRVDVLVNNAATGSRSRLVDQPASDVERCWGVILWGTWHCTQLAARDMIRRGEGGHIVSISSVMSEYTAPGSAVYSGAKAAINAMTRTWASELCTHSIRVNSIEPGWVDTPGERITFGNERIDAAGAALPLGRMGRPEDIAGAVAYLISDQASYITGTILRVDGGFTLVRQSES